MNHDSLAAADPVPLTNELRYDTDGTNPCYNSGRCDKVQCIGVHGYRPQILRSIKKSLLARYVLGAFLYGRKWRWRIRLSTGSLRLRLEINNCWGRITTVARCSQCCRFRISQLFGRSTLGCQKRFALLAQYLSSVHRCRIKEVFHRRFETRPPASNQFARGVMNRPWRESLDVPSHPARKLSVCHADTVLIWRRLIAMS